ncbi:hypothetical protein ABJI51_23630 [Amycolatopsis sp. NEAU-NG30]|uniref:Uncharacterized protein n=1 Tax=Amycolatopsis melonis TaxID=3156488 RepID=A0ABV0LL95_9PSEU
MECVTPRIPATCADAFVAAAEVAAYATRRNAVMRAMVAATERTANAVGGRTFDVGFR